MSGARSASLAALVRLLVAQSDAAQIALRLAARHRAAAEADRAGLEADHRARLAEPVPEPAVAAATDGAWQRLRARRLAELERRIAALRAAESAALGQARHAFGREQAARGVADRLAATARRADARRGRGTTDPAGGQMS